MRSFVPVFPARRARTWRARRWTPFVRPPAGTLRRCGCQSSSASRWRAGSRAARRTPPPRCAWPGTCRGSATRRCCASWGLRSAPTCPRRSRPGRWLASGAGEHLRELPSPSRPFGVLVLPVAAELSTAAVYREADRLELARAHRELEQRRLAAGRGAGARRAGSRGQGAAAQRSASRGHLAVSGDLRRARAGARRGRGEALVSGSGPTVAGPVPAGQRARAGRTRRGGPGRRSESVGAPTPICATPVDAAFARAMTDARSS